MKPEIAMLIIGAVVGAVLAFCVTELNKLSDRKLDEKKAIMCLKIELSAIKDSVDKVMEAQSMRGGGNPLIPFQDILELNMATEFQQFRFYEEELAEKVYNLSIYLRLANKHRQVAYTKTDSISQLSSPVFLGKLEQAQKILNEINKMIHFEEENSPKS